MYRAVGFRRLIEATTKAAMSALGLYDRDINELHVYNPSVQDILHVKNIIQQASKLPLELVDVVIDFAEYWACSTTETVPDSEVVVGSGLDMADYCEIDYNALILRSLPLGYTPECGYINSERDREQYLNKIVRPLLPGSDLSFLEPDTASVLEQLAAYSRPRGKKCCRKIVFTIVSKDQGWGGSPEHRGTYHGSYTWFDVGLEQFTAFKYKYSAVSQNENYSLNSMDGEYSAMSLALSEYPAFMDGMHNQNSSLVANRYNIFSQSRWPLEPESRRSWIKSSLPLLPDTGVQPSTEIANAVPIDPSYSGNSNPQSYARALREYLAYNLLTITPTTATDREYMRLDHPFLPPDNRLQTNIVGGTENKKHVIIWSFDDNVKPGSLEADELEDQGRGRESMTGEFIRDLKLGDVVTVWARARFPGWVNNVDYLKMDVFWAV